MKDKESNVIFFKNVNSGKIVKGVSIRSSLDISIENINQSLEKLANSKNEIINWVVAGLNGLALTSFFISAFLIGRATYQPKKVNVYNSFLSVEEKYMLVHDPNLSEQDSESGKYYPKVYTRKKYEELMKE